MIPSLNHCARDGAWDSVPTQPLGGGAHAMDLDLIDELDTSALYRMAEYYERTVRQVRLQIAERNAKAKLKADSDRVLHEIHRATLMASAMMKNGTPYERAMMEAAHTSGFGQATLEAHYKQVIKGDQETARRTMEITIMRLARSGLNNTEIAKKLGVGRNRVGRIIQEAVRA